MPVQSNTPQGSPSGLAAEADAHPLPAAPTPAPPTESGGPSGPEPTRYGDWERAGRCIDF